MEFLLSIDYFGRDFKFNIEGGSFRTSIGGLLSILVGMFTIFLSIFFGLDIYLKQDPAVLYSEYMALDPPNLGNTLNNSNFLIAMRLRDESIVEPLNDPASFELVFRNRIDKPVFNSTGDFVKKDKTTKLTRMKYCRPIELIKNQFGFVPQVLEWQPQLEQYFCAYENFSIGGPITRFDFVKNYTSFFLKYCDASTEKEYNVTCNNKSNIISAYKSKTLYIEMIYQKDIFNAENNELPLRQTFKYVRYDINIENDLAFHVDNNYNLAIVETDNGVLFPVKSNFTFNEFSYANSYHKKPDTDFDKNYIFKASIYSDNKFIYYKRSYIKGLDVVANIGGINSLVIFFLSQFFEIIYLKLKYNNYLCNRIFSMQLEESQPERNSQIELISVDKLSKSEGFKQFINRKKHGSGLVDKNINRFKANDIHSEREGIRRSAFTARNAANLKEINDPELIMNKELKKLLEFRSKQRSNVKIDFKQRYKILNGCCKYVPDSRLNKLKAELLLAADQEINDKTEILEIWKFNNRARLLEKLILNENQCFMMHNRGLQLITNDDDNSDVSTLRNLVDLKRERKIESLADYLGTRFQNNSLSELDYILYKYLDTKFKEDIMIRIKSKSDIVLGM